MVFYTWFDIMQTVFEFDQTKMEDIMKKLIFAAMIIFLACSCADNSKPDNQSHDDLIADTNSDTSTDATTGTVDTTSDTSGDTESGGQETVVDPAPIVSSVNDDSTADSTTDTPVFVEPSWTPNIVIITETEAFLSNGEETQLLASGSVKYVDQRLLAVENQLISYDQTVDVRMVFDQVPVQVLDNDSVYHCIEYDPDTAQSLGAQARWYSEFFRDGISMGSWFMNQMRCIDLISVGEIVWNIDENGSPQLIDGIASDVEYIHNGTFYIHSKNIVDQQISFNDLPAQDYVFNYIFAAQQWQEFESLWYSENGYTWSETAGLSENVNTLWDWNEQPFPIALDIGQYPTLVSAGVNNGLMYWIESNTGWLFAFDPASDSIEMVYRLYLGDGQRSTGTDKDLRPLMVWPDLYYFDGAWFQLNMETGVTSLFYAGSAEVLRW